MMTNHITVGKNNVPFWQIQMKIHKDNDCGWKWNIPVGASFYRITIKRSISLHEWLYIKYLWSRRNGSICHIKNSPFKKYDWLYKRRKNKIKNYSSKHNNCRVSRVHSVLRCQLGSLWPVHCLFSGSEFPKYPDMRKSMQKDKTR